MDTRHRRRSVALLLSGALVASLLPAQAVAAPAAQAPAARPVQAAAQLEPAAPVGPKAVAPPGPMNYAYDAVGRLVGAIQPTGDTAKYSYDAAGNVLRVDRYPSTQLSVLSVVPAAAPPGATVTVYGTGFATTPAGNAVTFNGTAATVSAATATSLRVAVPANATTGAVRVTVGGVQASGGTFTVTPGAPVITGMMPASGPPTTEVTVAGRNFDPVLGNDVVTIGGQAVEPVSVTATTLKFRVPSGAVGGRIQVMSPRGTATSAQDFFVPPATVDPSTVESYARMAVGTNATVRVNTGGKVAVVLFDAPVGQAVSVGISGSTFTGSIEASVVSPDGLRLEDGEDSHRGPFDLDLTGLRANQTYQLVIDPNVATDTGQVTVTLSEPLGGQLSATGNAAPVTIEAAGQDAQLSFDANEGDAVSLAFTANTLPRQAEIRVVGPTGDAVVERWLLTTGATKSLDIPTIPLAGAYRVVIDPMEAATGAISTTYSTWSSTGVVNRGGAAVTASITRAGQNAAVPFDGVAGQAAGFGLTSNTLTTSAALTILGPDGEPVGDDVRLIRGENGSIRVQRLPATGRYRLAIAPDQVGTGTLVVTYSAQVDAGMVTRDGTAITATVTRAGQDAAVGFDGAVGEASTVVVENTFPKPVEVFVLSPDGSQLAKVDVAAGRTRDVDLPKLTAAGRYQVVIAPADAATGSARVNLLGELNGGTLTIGGAARTVTFDRPGRNARLTFTATGGQRLRITVPANGLASYTNATLYSPNGAEIDDVDLRTTEGADLADLPGTGSGTYQLVLNPNQAGTGALTLALAVRTNGTVAAARTAPIAAAQPVDVFARPAARTAPPADPRSWTPGAASLGGRNWLTGRTPADAPDPLRAKAGTTAVSGHMLKLDGSPLVGASARIGSVATRTDRYGRFLLAGIPAGNAKLTVDGGPASTDADQYGVFHIKVTAKARHTTVLPFTVWMQRLDTEHMVRFEAPAKKDIILTTPKVPGLEVRIPAGSVIRDADGKVVTKLGITPIPLDQPPFPLPKNGIVPVYFTVQPGGTFVFPDGAQVVYPNYTKLAPHTRVDFWDYDPEGKGWYVYGRGEVSADGTQVVPDARTRVWSFHGAMFNSGARPAWLEAIFDDGFDWFDGDPVDLSTGRLTDSHTDLALSDTFPISVTRHYWQADDERRDFGTGWLSQYGMFFHSEDQYNEVDLYLPGGRKVHFVRVGGENRFSTAILEAVDTNGEYRGARVSYQRDPALGDGKGWVLTRRDGTVMVAPLYRGIVAIRDRNGNQISITWDGNRLVQVTSPNGRWIRFATDGQQRITSATDSVGRTVSYTYYNTGRLFSVTNPDGKVSRYTYTAEGRLHEATDARGITYLTNEYDANGRVSRQTLPNNREYRFAYTTNASGKVTQTRVTQPDGSVRRVTFNAAGAVVTDTDAFGTPSARTTTYHRDDHQQITAITDPLSRKTSFRHDDEGRLLYATELADTGQARVTGSYQYGGPFDQPLRYTDRNGKATIYDYELDGDLKSITDPANRVTRFTYNGAGSLLTVTDQANKVTTFTYRGGDLASVTDPLNQVTKQFTDAAGRPVAITDAMGAVTRISYDTLNQVTKMVDALGQTTNLGYDENGNLTSLTDARNNANTWTYDRSDRVESTRDPLDKYSLVHYDTAGRVDWTASRAGHRATYTTDALGRLRTITYGAGTPDAASITKGYDAVDRLTSISDDKTHEITSIAHDSFDRVTRVSSQRWGIGYTYDNLDRRQTMTVDGQPAVTYTYYDDGAPRTITRGDQVVEFQYDAVGRPSLVSLPGGWSRVPTYDAAGQVLSLTYRHGNVDKGALTYTYDAAGRVATVGGSLAQVAPPLARTGQVYNAANRLTSNAGIPLGYDDDGNLTSHGINSYQWNARGLLTRASGSGYTESFTYDVFGRQTDRSVNGRATSTQSDGSMPVRETSGNNSATMLSGGTDQWFSRTDSAGQRTFLTDLVGTVVALGDATGALKTQYAYDPYGAQTRTGENSSNTFGYTGRQRMDSGLMYNRARYYDPSLQRFISEDPIGFAGGTNLYAYAANSPTNYTDPSGNNPILVGCVVGGITDGLMDWAGQRLSGRKVDWGWGGVGGAAALGCAMGAVGAIFAGARGAASCAVNSFTADTEVLMADGSRKRIADVQPGDKVLAAPESSPDATPTAATVETVITGMGEKQLVDISVDGGDPITATDGHPFWLPYQQRWVDADQLVPGDWLRTSAGTYVQVTAIAHRKAWGTVYNLTVADQHTYYVVAGGSPVLVHNCKLHTANGPRVRPGPGPKTDIDVDAGGLVHPPSAGDLSSLNVQGMSTYDTHQNLAAVGLTGQVRAPTKPLADGLGVIADGVGVGGRRALGHHTIYPTRSMPFDEFVGLIQSMGWQNIGVKLK